MRAFRNRRFSSAQLRELAAAVLKLSHWGLSIAEETEFLSMRDMVLGAGGGSGDCVVLDSFVFGGLVHPEILSRFCSDLKNFAGRFGLKVFLVQEEFVGDVAGFDAVVEVRVAESLGRDRGGAIFNFAQSRPVVREFRGSMRFDVGRIWGVVGTWKL